MNKPDELAKAFESQRGHLRSVAYRMLGSPSEADDAVQEAWLRLSRSDAGNIRSLESWLTTVVARVCLDMLRARKARREDELEPGTTGEPIANEASDPEQEALLADSVGLALLVVLDTLAPAERVAFVLHDVFDLPFEEIAPIVGRNEAATRQLASRARRRVRGPQTTTAQELKSKKTVVDAFLAALRAGDFEGLLAVLDPEVVVHFDSAAGAPGAPREIRGARNWAQGAVAFSHLARSFVQPALINGDIGLIFAPKGKLSRALRFTIVNGKITDVQIIAEPEQVRKLNVSVLED